MDMKDHIEIILCDMLEDVRYLKLMSHLCLEKKEETELSV